MPGWLTLAIPIAAFITLAFVFALVLHGTGRIVGLTREGERFRRSVEDLSGRIDTSLGGVIERIDAKCDGGRSIRSAARRKRPATKTTACRSRWTS
jgi:hypothetical protein